MPDWRALSQDLLQHGIVVDAGNRPEPVAGGDINAAWRLATSAGRVFLKTSDASRIDMFSAEADGLRALAGANAVRVPQVIACGIAGTTSYIAMEWLQFARATRDMEEVLGRQLAKMHRTRAERHGWHRDNTIGLTPQPNAWSDDWIAFFREQRLIHQLRIAASNGFGGELQREGMQ
ncbi:MAG: fructosamine kinase family protein, partial [Gammaproteobacteria bacterium]|nr:fructosamine kinase family protein [Gammaproteobacteria bacterium]